jgi:hypothetical protein
MGMGIRMRFGFCGRPTDHVFRSRAMRLKTNGYDRRRRVRGWTPGGAMD